jgi:hypothetical protein
MADMFDPYWCRVSEVTHKNQSKRYSFKARNPKYQAPNHKEIPNTNIQ